MPDITSRQHAIVHAFKEAARGEGDQVLLDGWHLLHEAAGADLDVRNVAIAGEPPTARDAALVAQLARRGDVFTVTRAVMDAMSPVRTPTGVVALATPRECRLSQLLAHERPLVIVAVDIQDPGNVGAIVRSVEAGGGTGVVFAGASAHPWGWKALRAAMGSTFRLPVLRAADLSALLSSMREAGLAIVATVPRDGLSMHTVDLNRAAAILVGAEGAGLDAALVAAADEQLTIPMQPYVDSLNVAVAAALLVYEARRQREA